MLAERPPMGWNSWNTFGANITEELVMGIADAMVDRGLKDAGYEYVVIDDCWSLRNRDADGRMVADPAKFPHGMKYLSDYPFQRAQIRNVLLLRHHDLRGLSRQLRS